MGETEGEEVEVLLLTAAEVTTGADDEDGLTVSGLLLLLCPE